jgi:hypothetical protein
MTPIARMSVSSQAGAWQRSHSQQNKVVNIQGIRATSEKPLTGPTLQIWIAVSIYVLVDIVKKRLDIDASLYTLLLILSLTLYDKMPILQALSQPQPESVNIITDNQLSLRTR